MALLRFRPCVWGLGFALALGASASAQSGGLNVTPALTWAPADTLVTTLEALPDSIGADPVPVESEVAPRRTDAPRDTTDELRPRSVPITVFGYYRGFLYGREITEPYPGLEPFERVYGVGDGYREPTLSVNVLGRPNGRSSFGTELFLFSPYDGLGVESNTVSLNLGVNFYGTFRTEAGAFGVRAGGVH